ncbi:GNAT family N-acetyltransferase [Micromonospora matsumotoense]|uniref:GNAT family N-acetyltransferase n=1 Tax=Micromonospora matsumotoense TaxID=121616 RepID=UPI003D89F3CD
MVDAFRDRATAALGARNYELVTAPAGDELVGFVFGYSLRQDRDWFAGLQPAPEEGFTDERGGERTVVLAEIEVRKAWQGRGIGRGLHDAFLRGRREERATLSANPAATATHALYEGWGWQRGRYRSRPAGRLLPGSRCGTTGSAPGGLRPGRPSGRCRAGPAPPGEPGRERVRGVYAADGQDLYQEILRRGAARWQVVVGSIRMAGAVDPVQAVVTRSSHSVLSTGQVVLRDIQPAPADGRDVVSIRQGVRPGARISGCRRPFNILTPVCRIW